MKYFPVYSSLIAAILYSKVDRNQLPILINGKPVCVICGEFYAVTLNGVHGIIEVTTIQQQQPDDWSIFCKFYTKTKHLKEVSTK